MIRYIYICDPGWQIAATSSSCSSIREIFLAMQVTWNSGRLRDAGFFFFLRTATVAASSATYGLSLTSVLIIIIKIDIITKWQSLNEKHQPTSITPLHLLSLNTTQPFPVATWTVFNEQKSAAMPGMSHSSTMLVGTAGDKCTRFHTGYVTGRKRDVNLL